MRETLEKVLLVIGSTFLALLALEVFVRMLDVPPRPLAPLPIPSYRLSANPVIGYEYRPGYKPTDRPFDWSHQGYTINQAGFRDYVYTKHKPAGTFRIIVIGDSTTAGNGVKALEKTYPKVLEKILNKGQGSHRRYEVLNMGVGGYHTARWKL